MNTIANQVVAVVATISGFVTHDYLVGSATETPTVTRMAVADAIDPVVTRSIDLADVTIEDWAMASRNARRVVLAAPVAGYPRAARAARPDSRFANSVTEARLNNVRLAAPGRRSGLSAVR